MNIGVKNILLENICKQMGKKWVNLWVVASMFSQNLYFAQIKCSWSRLMHAVLERANFLWFRFSHKTLVSFSPDFSLHVLCSGCLEEGLEALLKATGSNLLILKISHCPNLLTDRSLWLASCFCRALQAVTYRYATAHRQWRLMIKTPIIFWAT